MVDDAVKHARSFAPSNRADRDGDPREPAVRATGASKKKVVDHLVAVFLLGSVFVAVILFVVAAWVYPGGTHFDHLEVGHDFWKNTLCDVARSTALGGAPNAVGAMLARAAMTIMAFGIGALFWLLPTRFPSSGRLGTSIRVLGAMAVLGAIAVVFLPTDRFSFLHGIAIVVAGLPGLSGMALAVAGLLRANARPHHVTAIGVLALLVAAADFSIYVDELLSKASPRVSVPVLERIATLLVLVWMVAVARVTQTRSSVSAEASRLP
jgi:hypothetical protein